MAKHLLILACLANILLLAASNDQKPKKCRRICRGLNEVYDECPALCPPQRCGVDIASVQCTRSPSPGDPECQPGCRCKDNYVRNSTDVCIPTEQCPRCPNPNEIYDPCIAPCPPRRCGVDELVRCSTPPQVGDPDCEEGCRCADGYVRNSDGLCVTRDQCPPTCPENENYNNCSISVCGPTTCDQVGYGISCPAVQTQDCKGGCVCNNGYVRNCDGVCMPVSECPTCGGDVNAVPGCGVHCNNKCSDIGKEPGFCILICFANACDCKKGFLYDEQSGRCVTEKECPPPCPVNEYYNECTNADCSPQNCTQLGFGIACPRIDPAFCQKGCLCKEGFARGSNGVCIPITQCPSCGGDPNAQGGGDGLNCGRLCSNYNKPPPPCPLILGVNGCDCKPDHVFDSNIKKCVKPKDCSPVCGQDEVYTSCINGICRAQNCSQLGKSVRCKRMNRKYCIKGCRCKKGYLRSSNGTCVPENKCNATPTCPANQYYSNCSNSVCGPTTCDQVGYGTSCPAVQDCKGGCVCNNGYVKNSDGVCVVPSDCPSCGGDVNAVPGCGVYCGTKCTDIGRGPGACPAICKLNGCDCKKGYYYDTQSGRCVPKGECPPTCPANEYYSNCSNSVCGPTTCDQVGYGTSCPAVQTQDCIGACVCKSGYARSSDGVCIPVSECPSCGGDVNAVSGCGVYCGTKCTDIGRGPVACPAICELNGCDCREGFYYETQSGRCVPKGECPPTCPANEYYSNCSNSVCGPTTCDQVGYGTSCPAVQTQDCIGACVCKSGYARSSDGVCIPVSECPSCRGDVNAVSGCGVYCGTKCTDIGRGPVACPAICELNGCDCREGFYYDTQSGRCVCKEECPPSCPANEYYNNCSNSDCGPKTCDDVGFGTKHCAEVQTQDCKGECLCKNGYVRNKDGVCIPTNDCPSCGGDVNAVSGCGVHCNDKCTDIGNQPRPCIRICFVNSCDCKEGFYYDEQSNTCMTKDQCPSTCGQDEVYSSCINGGCNAQNCSQLGKDVPCKKIDPKSCIKGCLCKEGYLRSDDGKCVPKKQCNPQCNRPNEIYDPCPYTCPPQTCESLNRTYECPLQSQNQKCVGACRCKEGHYRNKIGECIKEDECRMCMGPHEYFSCGGACDNVCSELKYQSQKKCPIINIKCNEMCYCEENYARAMNKTCIPINQCNEYQCPLNEKYDPCPSELEEPQSCSQLGFPIETPESSEKCTGGPGCICIDGLVRNDTGVCIPETSCPSCGGDPNAQSDSGVNCGKRCEDLGKEDIVCPEIYYVNSCDCRDGYYLDKISNKCVLPEECTGICPQNEVYDACTNGGCDYKDCSQLNGPKVCKHPRKCTTECKCKKDYLRAKNGTCIPIETCPEARCPKNEIFDICPMSSCQPQRCNQLGFPVACNSEDEDYCPGEPGCICANGYVRSSKGRCIPKKYCPSCGGDPNAVAGCGINCGRHCNNVFNATKQGRLRCPFICLPNACDCRPGYLYDDFEEKCVTPDQCTPPCPENEVMDSCVNGGCGIRNCSQFGGPILCIDPIKCKQGCKCQEGYLRDDNTGICVPEQSCPGICSRPHEVYDSCPNCSPQTCESIGRIYDCPLQPVNGSQDCLAQCRCETGYYRNKIGECIRKEDCLKCQGPNEYFSCGPECDNECSKIPDDTKDNCSILNIQCVPKCYCEDEFARNASNICIPINDCPERPKRSVCDDSTPSETVNDTTALANYDTGNIMLNGELIYQLAKSRPGESFMVSATSVMLVLSEVALYAIKTVLDQMLGILNLESIAQIRSAIPNVLRSYDEQEQVILDIYFSNYFSLNDPPSSSFERDALQIYNASIANVDFNKPTEAANTINSKVAEQTNGLIDKIVDASFFSSNTRAVLVNVIYFLGNWQSQFNANKTESRDFYRSPNETISIPTMYQQNRFRYGESDELNCQILSLPYKGGNMTFNVYLPKEKFGLSALLEKLRDADVYARSQKTLSYQTVNVYLPRMDIETDISDLKQLLMMLGLVDPFKPDADGFRCILDNDAPLYISDIVQKTRLKVNERGTEAAVVTAVGVSTTSVIVNPVIYDFRVNQPSAFYLSVQDNPILGGVFTGK